LGPVTESLTSIDHRYSPSFVTAGKLDAFVVD
jgi:hypothetical protein